MRGVRIGTHSDGNRSSSLPRKKPPEYQSSYFLGSVFLECWNILQNTTRLLRTGVRSYDYLDGRATHRGDVEQENHVPPLREQAFPELRSEGVYDFRPIIQALGQLAVPPGQSCRQFIADT